LFSTSMRTMRDLVEWSRDYVNEARKRVLLKRFLRRRGILLSSEHDTQSLRSAVRVVKRLEVIAGQRGG
jgi:hypothetical protein